VKLSETEKKIVMLAMDQVASDGEIAAAASRFFHSLRKRYKNGVDLIKALEAWDEVQRPMPAGPNPFASPFGGVSMTRPFGQAPPNPQQPRQQQAPPPRDPFDFDLWQDIMREAQQQASAFQQRQYQAHAEAFQQFHAAQQRAQQRAQQTQQTSEELRRHKEAQEQFKKKPLLKKIMEKFK